MVKLWSDRLKPHTPFVIARRIHIKTKWDLRRGNKQLGENEARDRDPIVIGLALNTKHKERGYK